jgi:hypothetical protein
MTYIRFNTFSEHGGMDKFSTNNPPTSERTRHARLSSIGIQVNDRDKV